MRRWLIALVLALAVSAIWAGAAFADASTYHSNYSATTRACASCHRAHTGLADNLLAATSVYGLCTSCHGTNSGLDVVDGTEWQTDASHANLKTAAVVGGTKGGGFVNSLMNTTMDATGNPVLQPAALKASTSAHGVNGMSGYTGGTMWGSGAISGTANAGTGLVLECTTCHDPHGQSGVDSSGNKIPTYRLLRSDVAFKAAGASTARVNVPEDAATSHEYVVDSSVALVPDPTSTTTNPKPDLLPTTLPAVYGTYYGQTYSLTGLSDTASMQALSNWCATCHTRIHATSANASGDAIYNFRHPTNGGATDNNYHQVVAGQPASPSGYPGCLTCHTAHGSSAAMSTRIAIPKPDGNGNLDSSLLRVNDRGVCELCHNK